MDGTETERLVMLYADMILRISCSYLKQTCDAEDICQTVFLKLLTHDLQFDSPAHEKAWIIRTTVNCCRNHFRTAFFRRTVPLEEADAIAAPPAPENEILQELKHLPEKYRVPIYLYYYEDYSAREIGEILGKSERNIHQYLSRGRKLLRTHLEKEGDYFYGT